MAARTVKSRMNPLVKLATIPAMLIAFVLALAAQPPAAQAQAVPEVLNFATTDAEVIIVAPNLAQASKKISQFVEALGFKDIPELADPLGSLKKQLGVQKGLNENGSLLVCISGVVAAAQNGSEPDVAILMPVSDYKDFVGNFEPKEEDGITVLSMPNGQPGYAKNVGGGYCLMGPHKESVAKYKAGNAKDALAKAAGKIGAKHLASNDLSIYINMKALAPQVRPMLKDAYDLVKEQLEAFDGQEGPQVQFMAMGKGMMASSFDAMDAVLRDGDAIVLGADMSTKGVGFTATFQFRAGSPLAKMFPGGKGDAAGMTAMLPNNPYLFAMGMDLRGIDLKGMLDEFVKRMPKDNWFADMIKSSTAMLPHTKRIGQVYYAPANAANLVMGMSGVSVVDTTDPAAYTKATKGYFDAMNKLKVDLGEIEGTKLDFTFTTTYKENALSPEAAANVGGAKVDEYIVKMNLPKALLDKMGEGGNMISMMLRQAGYVATVDKTIMMTTTVDTNLVKAGVEAIKQGNGLGSSNLIKQVRESGLPADANFEMYVNVGSITQLFNQFTAMAEMFNVPGLPEIPQIEVPNNLPPLAMGGQVDSGGLSARLYVPMPVISWVKDTYMKFQSSPDGQPKRQPGAKPAPF